MRGAFNKVLRLTLLAGFILVLGVPLSNAQTTDYKINFRASSGHVTDGTGETYMLGEGYSVTRDGVTMGWETSCGDCARDRGTSDGPKFAGVNKTVNNGTQETFRVDLPSTGEYDIRIAAGDWQYSTTYQYIQILDDATVITTIDDSDGLAGNDFHDAAGNERNPTDWNSNNVKVTHTFTSTILRIKIGTPSDLGTGSESRLAHLQITSVDGGGGGGDPVYTSGFNSGFDSGFNKGID